MGWPAGSSCVNYTPADGCGLSRRAQGFGQTHRVLSQRSRHCLDVLPLFNILETLGQRTLPVGSSFCACSIAAARASCSAWVHLCLEFQRFSVAGIDRGPAVPASHVGPSSIEADRSRPLLYHCFRRPVCRWRQRAEEAGESHGSFRSRLRAHGALAVLLCQRHPHASDKCGVCVYACMGYACMRVWGK